MRYRHGLTDRYWKHADCSIVFAAMLSQQGRTHLRTDNKALCDTRTAAATALSDKEQLQSMLEE